MNNPMEYFRKGAEKKKAESLKGKSMYQDGDEFIGPKTEADATLEKMQILNDMGLMGRQNFFPGSKISMPERSPANPALTEKDKPAAPYTDRYGRPIKPRSMVQNAMMRKLRGQ